MFLSTSRHSPPSQRCRRLPRTIMLTKSSRQSVKPLGRAPASLAFFHPASRRVRRVPQGVPKPTSSRCVQAAPSTGAIVPEALGRTVQCPSFPFRNAQPHPWQEDGLLICAPSKKEVRKPQTVAKKKSSDTVWSLLVVQTHGFLPCARNAVFGTQVMRSWSLATMCRQCRVSCADAVAAVADVFDRRGSDDSDACRKRPDAST